MFYFTLLSTTKPPSLFLNEILFSANTIGKGGVLKISKRKKEKKKNEAIQEERKTGFGDKKLEGPNRPAE